MGGSADRSADGSSTRTTLVAQGLPVDVDTSWRARPMPGAAVGTHLVGDAVPENLFALGERLAARAAAPSTRKQYAAVYRSFGDWLLSELGRAPTTADLRPDAVAAWHRHLETGGGRGGGPAAPATRRIYLKTLTHGDYANLLLVPDARSQLGKRDRALLRVMGDCGLRSAELRGLTAGALRRPRANARNQRLYVRGKGGTERELPVPDQTQRVLDAWLAVHPLSRGAGLRDDEPIFVRIGRHRGAELPERLSAQAVHKAVRKSCLAAGVPERLSHPHTLRAYWATTLLEDGVPVHVVSSRLGHADLRTTGRYAADRVGHGEDLADVLDRRHQVARRSGGGGDGPRG
jgi:integrase